MRDAGGSSGEESSDSNSNFDHPEVAIVPKIPDESQSWTVGLAHIPPQTDPDDFVVFRDRLGGRDALDRARLWSVLQERLLIDEPLEFRDEMTKMDKECSKARVPAIVAGEGQPATASYLAAHGFSNDEVADALQVNSRTVSQYLSDFRTGER